MLLLTAPFTFPPGLLTARCLRFLRALLARHAPALLSGRLTALLSATRLSHIYTHFTQKVFEFLVEKINLMI